MGHWLAMAASPWLPSPAEPPSPPPGASAPCSPLGSRPIGDRHLLQMAPQMDRLPALGEARCEISRGEQAKGGGAVLKRLGGILLSSPPCHSSNWSVLWQFWVPGPDSGLIQTGCRGRKSRRVEAALGVCLRLLPLDVVAVPRETARCYTGEVTLYEGVVVAVLQEEPTRFARTQTRGPRGITHKWTLLRGTEVPSGFPRLASRLLHCRLGRYYGVGRSLLGSLELLMQFVRGSLLRGTGVLPCFLTQARRE